MRYTVGWAMPPDVERRFSRERIVEPLCDPAKFLADYYGTAADAGLP